MCTTISTNERSATLSWDAAPRGGDVALGVGGDVNWFLSWDGDSTKKEYEMSLEMQSRLAIINFSFRVSHASLRGSKISRGRSPPSPARTISNARCTASLRGGDRLASLEDAIVSRAVEMRTADTVLPFEMVSERRCPGGVGGTSDGLGLDIDMRPLDCLSTVA